MSPVRYDENEVVDTCGRAARRLWTRTGSVASRATHLDSLVGDLLNAIATAAAAEGASVPEGVQHAALRLDPFEPDMSAVRRLGTTAMT